MIRSEHTISYAITDRFDSKLFTMLDKQIDKATSDIEYQKSGEILIITLLEQFRELRFVHY